MTQQGADIISNIAIVFLVLLLKILDIKTKRLEKRIEEIEKRLRCTLRKAGE